MPILYDDDKIEIVLFYKGGKVTYLAKKYGFIDNFPSISVKINF